MSNELDIQIDEICKSAIDESVSLAELILSIRASYICLIEDTQDVE